MTIKNSIISVSAAALLVAGITGCSSNGTTTTAATTTTTTSALTTAVKAVDGYVMNATVTAYFTNEDNTTMGSVALTGTDSSKDPLTGNWTDGSATYSLPSDANDTVKNGLKFYKLTYKAAVPATATTGFKPATYLENGYAAGFDANDTAAATTFALYAPANSGIISPISSLLYQANSATLGTETAVGTVVTDLNTSYLTNLENNATNLAATLGLGSVNLLTADPVALAGSNPTFTLVNALLKDTATQAVANALLTAAAPASATLTNTLTTLTTAGGGGTLATTLLSQAQDGTFTTSSIASLAIDKSVAAGTPQNAATVDNSTKFQVTDINITTALATSTLNNSGTGAKYKIGTDSPVVTIATDNDKNISNKSFNIIVSKIGDKARINDTDNNSSAGLVLSIPMEMNSTDGVIDAIVKPSSMVKWEVRDTAGGYIKTGESNASVLGLDAAVAITESQANTTGDFSLTINTNGIINAVVTNMDGNVTGSYVNTAEIGDLQVLIVDGNSTDYNLVRVISGYTTNMPAASSVTSLGGTITATTGAKNILNLTTGDMRTGVATQINVVPSSLLTVTNNGGAGTLANPFVLNNNAAFNGNLAASAFQTYEKNTTFAITSEGAQATAIVDKNSTYINTVLYNAADTSGASAATNIFDVNTTSTTAGELNSTVTYKVTDEFGDANTSSMYVRINRPAYLTSNTFAAGTDGNKTLIIGDYDGNGSIGAMAIANVPMLAAGSEISILCNDNVLRSIAIGGLTKDCNISNAAVYTDANYTINFHSNGYLELNQTIGTLSDINFTIVEINATDLYSADFNLTLDDANTTY